MRVLRWLLAMSMVVMTVFATSACRDPEVAKRQYLESGKKYLAAHKIDEAIVEFRNAIRQDQRFGEARWQLAEAYAQAKNPQAAFREFVRAADLLPTNTHVQITAANYLLGAQQFEDAKTRAEGVLKREPQNVDALIIRANGMAGLKDVAGAVEEIEQALKVEQTDGRLYTSLGTLQLIQGQRDAAEAAFKKAIEVSPKSVQTHLALANFYVATNRLSDAEQSLKLAVGSDPGNKLANRMLAALYLLTRRAREAEQPLKVTATPEDPESRLALADYYLATERPNDAVPLLTTLAAEKSYYAAATLRLARIDYSAGRRDAAGRTLDGLIAKEPQNAAALSLKSRWQLEAKQLGGALESARAAVAADPASAEAQFTLGGAHAANGNRDEAIAALTEVLRLNPRLVTAQVLLSRLQLEAGNFATALQVARQAKSVQPNDPNVQLTLARSLLSQGNASAAEPEVRALLARYPQYATSHSINGWLLLAKNDAQGARTAFGRALDLDANLPDALEGLLQVDARSKTLPSAIARIEERIAKAPANPSLLFVAARTYTIAGQPGKAEQSLRHVIDIAPENMTAYLMLGKIYLAQNRLNEALGQFDTVAKRHPSQVGPSTMAAMIVQMQNKTAEAQKRYEAIVAGSQQAPVAANNLAWIYADGGGNLDVALQLAQTAKSRLSDIPEVNDTLGWVYYKKNLPALAIPPLEQSVKTDPNNPVYRFHLGLAYAKAGQNAKARTDLEHALRISPQFEGAEEAKRTLLALKSD